MTEARKRGRVIGGVLVAATCLAGSSSAQAQRTPTQLGALVLQAHSPLTRTARLNVQNIPLGAALVHLRQRSGVDLAYSTRVIPPARRVDCECAGVTVAEALDRMLAGTFLRYVELDGQVIIEPRARPEHLDRAAVTTAVLAPDRRRDAALQMEEEQTPSIIGVVYGVGARPVVSARVFVVGTTRQSTTDAEGRFRITDVSEAGLTIRILAIGYQPLMRNVRAGTEVQSFQLVESPVNLDELIVTGTVGATEKRAIGNSIGQVKASEVLELAPAADAVQLINGRVPGVLVQPSTGVVGGGGRIRIRGASSISLFGRDPLLYVDGIRVDNRAHSGPGSQGAGAASGPASRMNDINAEDIESIEIVKGPAAAVLYGTEATGGVIQIITKRGSRSGRAEISTTVKQGTNWFMSAEERWPSMYSRVDGEILEVNLVRNERERGTPMFRNGRTQGYGVNLKGGAERVRYFASLDVDHETGIEPTNTMFKLGGRTNLDLPLSDRFDIGVNLGLVSSDLQLPMETGTGMWRSEFFGNPATVNSPFRGFDPAPPEVWHRASESRSQTSHLIAGLRLQHRPTTWFNHRLTLGMDLVSSDNFTLFRNIASIPEFAPFNLGGGGARLGTKWSRREQLTTNTVDYAANATANLRPSIVSTSSVGLQYYRTFNSFATAEGREFPDFSVRSISAAATTFGSDNFTENATVGMYFQQQFALSNRLFLTAAIRADDNSAFGEAFDLVTYPKVAASWVVSEEGFWPLRFVDVLKLRAAYGQAGQQPAAFSAVRTYTAIGGPAGPGLRPGASGNPDLGPERGEEIEVGLEASLFGSRVSIDASYYHKTTRDAILGVPTIPSQGFIGTRLVNAGVLQNQGVELGLTARVLDGTAVALDLGVNVSRNDNKVLELANGATELPVLDDRLSHKVGYPAFSSFIRKVVSADLGSDGVATNILCDGGPGNAPMSCASAPGIFVGSALPKTEGSVSSTLTLGGRVRLYALVDFKLGHQLFDNSILLRCLNGRCRERFYPTEYDPLWIATTQNPSGLFDWSIRDAGFAKLRELSANMALPSAWARVLGARSGSVTVAGRNLHTWTNWTGLDPESYQVNNVFSLALGSTPQLAQIAAAINLVF